MALFSSADEMIVGIVQFVSDVMVTEAPIHSDWPDSVA